MATATTNPKPPQVPGDAALRIAQADAEVRRNNERFPPDFMFQLSKDEAEVLVSQNVIPSRRSLGGFLPYVFTQEGVAMLSSVLRSKRAVQVNVAIMRAFVRLRELLATRKDLGRKLAELEKKYDEQFQVVFEAIRALMAPPSPDAKPGRIGFRAYNNCTIH